MKKVPNGKVEFSGDALTIGNFVSCFKSPSTPYVCMLFV